MRVLPAVHLLGAMFFEGGMVWGQKSSSYSPQASVASTDSEITSVLAKNTNVFRNPLGQVTREVEHLDNNQDGAWDQRSTVTYRYDMGQLVEKSITIVDLHNPLNKRFEIISFEYDAAGYVVSEYSQVDDGYDGLWNSNSLATFTYENGRPVVKTVLIDEDADGKPDRQETTQFQYAPDGNIIEEFVEIDDNNNGTINRTTRSVFTYSGSQIAWKTFEVDDNADGTVNYREEVAFSDSPEGNRQETIEVDENADGIINRRLKAIHATSTKFEGSPLRTFAIAMNIGFLAVLLFVYFRHKSSWKS